MIARGSCLAVLAVAGAASVATGQEKPFRIEVVDRATGRGVPLVELETTGGLRYVTDSAGVVAFDEAGLLGRKVWFTVRGHGYEHRKDGFGFRGVSLETRPSGTAKIIVDRLNVAERLYRVTGQGIYRDTVLTGGKPPLRKPLLNGGVVGQDTVLAVPFGGRVLWFWGDTHRVRYPLGLFETSGAWSKLPGQGGPDPAVGVDLHYFTGRDGFSRAMCPIEGPGVVWIGGVCVATEKDGSPALVCHYSRRKGLTEPLENGLARWNAKRDVFKKWRELPLNETRHVTHHPTSVRIDGVRWLVAGDPFPRLRVRATLADVGSPDRYEAWTPDRGWHPTSSPLPRQREYELRDVDTGRKVRARPGSVRWNPHRRRWIAIFGEVFGKTSMLGETWYAEADTITGPWVWAKKIVTHDGYSFYNVTHHAFMDAEGGRRIFFEGTYTTLFAKTKVRTPRYDYNQIMYALDLDDPRLHLPVAVYRWQAAGAERFGTREAAEAAGAWPKVDVIAFFARPPDRPGAGSIPVRGDGGTVRFHALPRDSKTPGPTVERHEGRVWPNPLQELPLSPAMLPDQ
ncbi:MAG: hypothetical protein CMJ83_09605 [Planctomycetes bacterium]|nr:hypothetical protein [Planctomycetota bacterium]